MGELVSVVRNDGNHHYEAMLDGTVVGFVRFRERPGEIILVHTETNDAYEGRGVGSALARAALDDVRTRGAKAIVQCPFIREYIQRHPEYADLVVPDP